MNSLVSAHTDRRSPAGGTAFTIIELLVVVAIITILAAILLPTLQQAKEAGKRTKCMSNLRQIGMTTSLFNEDNEGLFPAYSYYPDTNLWSYLNIKALPNYPKEHIFFCPSAVGKPSVNAGGFPGYDQGGAYFTDMHRTYGYNAWLQGIFTTPYITKVQQVSIPSRVMWSVDCTTHRFDHSFYWMIPGFRHGGNYPGDTYTAKTGGAGFNAVFVDGHAEWIPWTKFLAWRDAGWPANPFLWH